MSTEMETNGDEVNSLTDSLSQGDADNFVQPPNGDMADANGSGRMAKQHSLVDRYSTSQMWSGLTRGYSGWFKQYLFPIKYMGHVQCHVRQDLTLSMLSVKLLPKSFPVEWLTEVLGSILSQGPFHCGLEQVILPQLLR